MELPSATRRPQASPYQPTTKLEDWPGYAHIEINSKSEVTLNKKIIIANSVNSRYWLKRQKQPKNAWHANEMDQQQNKEATTRIKQLGIASRDEELEERPDIANKPTVPTELKEDTIPNLPPINIQAITPIAPYLKPTSQQTNMSDTDSNYQQASQLENNSIEQSRITATIKQNGSINALVNNITNITSKSNTAKDN